MAARTRWAEMPGWHRLPATGKRRLAAAVAVTGVGFSALIFLVLIETRPEDWSPARGASSPGFSVPAPGRGFPAIDRVGARHVTLISSDAVLATPTPAIQGGGWVPRSLVVGILALMVGGAMGRLAWYFLCEWRARLGAERRGSASEARYRLIAEHSTDVITLRDMDGTLRYVSPSITDLLGWSPQELVGHAADDILVANDRQVVARGIAALVDRQTERITETLRARRRDGGEVWIETHARLATDPRDGAVIGVVTNIRDITERKQIEERLERAAADLAVIAATDSLTSLPNRRSFDAALAKEWRRALRENAHLSLLMIDADTFKGYNDHYGHQNGDEALRAIAACIQTSIRRASDHAARYGGEEFTVLLPATDGNGAAALADSIRRRVAALDLPHETSPLGRITVTIGVSSIIPHRDAEPAGLVAEADFALYEAKRAGRNRVVLATGTPPPAYALSAETRKRSTLRSVLSSNSREVGTA